MDSRLEKILFKMSNILTNIVKRLNNLESIAHPPRDFVKCEDCKQKIREIDNGKKG